MITANQKEFNRVVGLQTENWRQTYKSVGARNRVSLRGLGVETEGLAVMLLLGETRPP